MVEVVKLFIFEGNMKLISNIIFFFVVVILFFFSTVFIIYPNLVYDEMLDIRDYYNGSVWQKIKHEWSLITKCQKTK